MPTTAWKFLIGLLFVSASVVAQDTIYFKNGDRLSGRIKNMQRGTLLFSCPALDGDARVGWNRIARVESRRTFQFETTSGDKFLGLIKSRESESEKEGAEKKEVKTTAEEIYVERLGDSQEFRQSDIILAVETIGKGQALIEADVGGGMTLTKSNSLRQFNLDAAVRLRRPTFSLDVGLNSIFTAQSGIDNTQRHDFKMQAARTLTRRWDLIGIMGLLQSEEQKLDLRSTAGGGLAYSLVRSNRSRLQAVMGSVWTNERYQADAGIPERNNAEGLLGLTFALFKFKMWTLDSTLFMMPSYTTPGRLRADFNTTLKWRLIEGKSLWWNFSQVINYDNRPPSNAPGTDYVSQTSVTWSFP